MRIEVGMLSNLDRNKIECLTWDLLNDLKGPDKTVPPIDIDLVAEKAGLKIKQGLFRFETIGIYDRTLKSIYLTASESYLKKSFIAACCIGHFYLHEDRIHQTFKRYDLHKIEEGDEQEQEAKFFAACLLIPAPTVRNFLDDIGGIDNFADKCDVLSILAWYRFKNIGLY